MNEILKLILVNIIIFPVVIYREIQYLSEIYCNHIGTKGIELKTKRIFSVCHLLKRAGIVPLAYYLVAVIPTTILSLAIFIFSLIKILLIAFPIYFKWFTTEFLVIVGFSGMGYSVVMMILFSLLSRFTITSKRL